MNEPERKRFKRLKQKLYFALILNVILVSALTYSTAEYWMPLFDEQDQLYEGMRIEKDAPYAEEVARVIKPLRYSGLKDFAHPRVSVALDFENHKWTLKNVHRYDEQQRIQLAEGKYGICGDLAVYGYQKLRPIFDKEKYHIQFMQVAEAGYFGVNRGGTHVILRVIDKTLPAQHPRKIFLIDPSYKRYGGLDLFDQYYPLREFQYETFLKDPLDEVFKVDNGPPIVINKKAMLLFSVKKVQDKFDRDHYSFALNMVHRYGYLDHMVYKIYMDDGMVREWQDVSKMKNLITKETYLKAKKAVKAIFEKAVPAQN